MPFDYDSYQKKCNVMTAEQLQKEWENYTRQITAGATGTATSVLLMPYTGGLSAVGLGVSAPRIHNARKKREIIEASLRAQGATPHTRKRDVFVSMGVSGAVSGLTLGVVTPGVADVAVGAAFHHSVEYAASQAALGGSGAILVHTTDQLSRSGEFQEEFKPPNALDNSNLEDGVGDSVYNTRPHASHSWSFDSASTTDTMRSGPLATPYADDESVLFHPILEENENENDQPFARPQFFSEPIDSGTYQSAGPTDAQQELLERMKMLQVEMQKRQTYGQGDPANVQASSQQMWGAQVVQIGHGPGNDGQGLGIIGADQHHSSTNTNQESLDYLAQQIHPFPTHARPHPYQRSESLPATLHSQYNYPASNNGSQYHEDHSREPLPSYQQHYFPPPPQPGMSFQQQEYAPPTKLPLPPTLPDRQDSGYCSIASTPSLANYPPQPNTSQQYILSSQVSSPQPYATPTTTVRHSVATTDTGLHRHNHVTKRHRASESAVSSASTSLATSSSQDPTSPPPPPYSQPSITVTNNATEKDSKDYFSSQGFAAADPSPLQSLAKKKSQAILKELNQGWQWAKTFPIAGDSKTKQEVERDYGPPPDIPVPWASR